MLIYVDFCWIFGFKLGAKSGGWRGVEGIFFVLGPIWLRKVLVLAQALEFVEAQASLKEGVWGRMGRRGRRIRFYLGLSWCYLGALLVHFSIMLLPSLLDRIFADFGAVL